MLDDVVEVHQLQAAGLGHTHAISQVGHPIPDPLGSVSDKQHFVGFGNLQSLEVTTNKLLLTSPPGKAIDALPCSFSRQCNTHFVQSLASLLKRLECEAR